METGFRYQDRLSLLAVGGHWFLIRLGIHITGGRNFVYRGIGDLCVGVAFSFYRRWRWLLARMI
jgi:hypothetical protein